jgi:ABC-2 type transport system permease protein
VTEATTDRGSRSDRRAALVAFYGLLLRDYRVVTKERGRFLVRTVSQPLLLVFVFTYVLPTIGRGFGESGDGGSFTDILVPGVLAIAILIKGLQAVALPLVQEFGYTREIEDRVMAPLPVWGVAVEKIVAGAVQGLVGAAIVAPIVAFVPAEPVVLSISWPALVAVLLLAPVVSSSLGLCMGTYIETRNVPLMFSVVILPITFLGATYFPWSELTDMRWLQIVMLANPLVYIAEGFRMALTPQVPHMPAWAILGALTAFAAGGTLLGIRGLKRRVLS